MEPKPIPKLPKKLLPAMSKRAPLDLNQFKIDLPKPNRDPLESIIPTTPPPAPSSDVTVPVYEARNVRPHARSSIRSGGRTDTRLIVLPSNRTRIRIRHPFNIYADQLEALQRIQLERMQAGKKKPTLAKMVTQALDQYLKEQHQKSISKASVRTFVRMDGQNNDQAI